MDAGVVGNDYEYYEVKPQQTYDILINDEVLKSTKVVEIVNVLEVISYDIDE